MSMIGMNSMTPPTMMLDEVGVTVTGTGSLITDGGHPMVKLWAFHQSRLPVRPVAPAE